MKIPNKRFVITKELIDALNERGKMQLIKSMSYSARNGKEEQKIEDLIGKTTSLMMAEALLAQERLSEIGLGKVVEILKLGIVEEKK